MQIGPSARKQLMRWLVAYTQEITEMIHTANLVHRGVVNLDTLNETDGSYRDMEFGNKIAVLSGDFLLTSASTGLAELRNTKVVELVSMAIGDMMSAEFTSLRDRDGHPILPEGATFKDWERQTFLQSGSLLSRSCQSSLELAGHVEELQTLGAQFGENIAYARQMNEDIMPFLNPSYDPNGVLASGPVIRHAEKHGHSSINPSASKEEIICTVKAGDSVEWCKDKCRDYGSKAMQSLDSFEPSEARAALINIVQATTTFKSSKS
ncbi:DLP1-like protein [Mya arenaria]|uniref:DLP1-like protein n=1 Tax=Mya arenaria TaxID=6604 RepID=A0ABY7EHR2_MYAAR|nr:DLP1-like protein [Mya arenaria]